MFFTLGSFFAIFFLYLLQISPLRLPDLLSGSPLIISGRFKGNFPEVVKARGFLADLTTHVIDINVRKANDMPLEMVNILNCALLK